jgi:hypothetical protein
MTEPNAFDGVPPARPVGPAPPVGQVPAYGYQVPPSAYPGTFAGDPLVTPPGEGFSGWFRRLVGILRRSWRRIVAITLITYGIPLAVFGVLIDLTVPRFTTVTNADGTQVPHLDAIYFPLFVTLGIGVAIVVGYLTGVANAAVVWSVTREAAGQAAPLGDALRYGLRNGVRLWGWSLLYGLVVLAGSCACLLPGLYCALAGCLYAPIALYARGQNPISTSFSMINKNLGPSLGRMAALVAVVYAARLVLTVPVLLVTAASQVAGNVLSGIVDLVTAPLAVLVTLGTVLLFAELRARVYPTTTAALAAELAA